MARMAGQKSDIERIVKMHISPVNVSVHTTNPELRCKMMHNKFAGDALAYLQILKEGNININAQIVLCRDINDKKELDNTSSAKPEKYIFYLLSLKSLILGQHIAVCFDQLLDIFSVNHSFSFLHCCSSHRHQRPPKSLC